MNAQLIRIGNSRGVRLPREVLEHYHLQEGAMFVLEERQEGILLKPQPSPGGKSDWARAYAELAAEQEGDGEWHDWDNLAGDGLHD